MTILTLFCTFLEISYQCIDIEEDTIYHNIQYTYNTLNKELKCKLEIKTETETSGEDQCLKRFLQNYQTMIIQYQNNT